MDGSPTSEKCKVKIYDDQQKMWSLWIPGRLLSSQNISYPSSPTAHLYLVEYPADGSANPRQGWFNPALGIVWLEGHPEPKVNYRESMAIYRTITSVMIAINSPATIAGKRQVCPVWYKATLGPAGMGESTILRGVQIDEGHFKGEFLTGREHLDSLTPGDQQAIDTLIAEGAVVWDDRRKSVWYKAGVGL